MAEIRPTRVDQDQTKVRSVPIAVTPEGFWCCPSPAVFQKTLKTQSPLNKPKPSSPNPNTSAQKREVSVSDERRTVPAPSRLVDSDAQQCSVAAERAVPKPKTEKTLPKKVAIEFGEPGTCDMKVVLTGKQGFCVKLSLHRDVLTEKSSFFAEKFYEDCGLSFLRVDDCEDVEMFVETVGLMYCREMKQRLMKQTVSRILRILKVICFLSCFDVYYLL